MLAELTSRQPQNLDGSKDYEETFSAETRGLYAMVWEKILESEEDLEMMRR